MERRHHPAAGPPGGRRRAPAGTVKKFRLAVHSPDRSSCAGLGDLPSHTASQRRFLAAQYAMATGFGLSTVYLVLYNGLLATAWCGNGADARRTSLTVLRARVFWLAVTAVAVSGPGSTFEQTAVLLFYAQARAR